MEKSTLERLVDLGLSTRQMSEQLGRSQNNVVYWLKKHKLKSAHKQYNFKGENSRRHTCKCGETDPEKFYKVKYMCRKCFNQQSVEKNKRYKQEAVEYKGGKCQLCGYEKYAGSLAFHHLDPGEKDPSWKKMKNWPLEKRKAELDKCILVCHNCHGEIHGGLVDLKVKVAS